MTDKLKPGQRVLVEAVYYKDEPNGDHLFYTDIGGFSLQIFAREHVHPLPAPGTCEEGYLMWVPKRAIDAEEG